MAIMNNMAIIEKLASNRKFRDEFFVAPRQALSKAGLEAGKEEIQEIERMNLNNIRCDDSVFHDGEILRCSIE